MLKPDTQRSGLLFASNKINLQILFSCFFIGLALTWPFAQQSNSLSCLSSLRLSVKNHAAWLKKLIRVCVLSYSEILASAAYQLRTSPILPAFFFRASIEIANSQTTQLVENIPSKYALRDFVLQERLAYFFVRYLLIRPTRLKMY